MTVVIGSASMLAARVAGRVLVILGVLAAALALAWSAIAPFLAGTLLSPTRWLDGFG